jgi:hypothetical protein
VPDYASKPLAASALLASKQWHTTYRYVGAGECPARRFVMSDLTNLSEDECALLMELLEKEQQELKPGFATGRRSSRPGNKSRRREVVGQLLWRVRVACPRPSMLECCLIAERLGGYY